MESASSVVYVVSHVGEEEGLERATATNGLKR